MIELDLDGTIVRLEELVVGFLGMSEDIVSETGAIASSSTALSSRGERRAATLEQTAVAMEGSAATVGSTAEGAKLANTAAGSASGRSEKGGEVVTNAIAAMKGIGAGTEEIGKIVEVIDGIAFQTNLLALNAGVESIQAGMPGAALLLWHRKFECWRNARPTPTARLTN